MMCTIDTIAENTKTRKTKRRRKDIEVLYLRVAQTGVDPMGFADTLIVWGYIVEAGVQMEHEEEITNGAYHSDRAAKMLSIH